MPYLLDTNAISEPNKPQPDPQFTAWFDNASTNDLYLSCLTIGELYKGIEMLPDSKKRRGLEQHTMAISDAFGDHLLIIDPPIAKLWAKLTVSSTKKGRSPSVVDAFLAAHALHNNLILVTRNVKDFEQFPNLQILSPWTN